MYDYDDVFMEKWRKREWKKCEYLLISRYEIILQIYGGSMNDTNGG